MEYIVNNAYLNIPAVTVNDPVCVQHMMDKMAAGTSWSAQTFSHHVNTTTGTQDTVQINARVFDLNGLITILRQQTNVSQPDKMGISKRSIQGITQYQYTIGSQQYPPQPIKIKLPEDAEIAAGVQAITAAASSNVSQSFSELKRGLKHVKGGQVNVSQENYGQSAINAGCGLLSVDVAAYNDDSTASGLDTKSTSMPVSLDLSKASFAGALVLQADSYALSGIEFTRLADGRLVSSY